MPLHIKWALRVDSGGHKIKDDDYDAKFRLSYFHKCKEWISILHLSVTVLVQSVLIHIEQHLFSLIKALSKLTLTAA